ncbi:putative divalent cation/proton antiporter TMEM165 isoform X1 [Lycorma delicatula]|uniref:putative divalent cation/proton antiporter TMEM165 isoform X1 n=1 Tax=Lycorma delicatula TaxID=130591 RepID=UPI003F50EC20
MTVKMNVYRYKLFILTVLWTIFIIARAEKEPAEPGLHEVEKGNLERSTEYAVPTGPAKTAEPVQAFLHAFVASLSVIVVSEIGDKTFFIAAIMAMKHSRLTVFAGAISALAFMTVLSVVFGYAATVIPRAYTFYVSTALFALFGLKMLREGYYMSPTEGQEEFEEVQSDLRKREDEAAAASSKTNTVTTKSSETVNVAVPISEKSELKDSIVITQVVDKTTTPNDKAKLERESLTVDVESASNRRKQQNVLKAVSRIFLQAFTLTFVAEWGDRSQLTTIILAAREDVFGVTLGGIIGHALCTGLAVLGGRFIAQRISVRTVTIIGGVVFLVFALSALIFNPVTET